MLTYAIEPCASSLLAGVGEPDPVGTASAVAEPDAEASPIYN